MMCGKNQSGVGEGRKIHNCFDPSGYIKTKKEHTLIVGVFECSESLLVSGKCYSAKEDEGEEEGDEEDDVDVSVGGVRGGEGWCGCG